MSWFKLQQVETYPLRSEFKMKNDNMTFDENLLKIPLFRLTGWAGQEEGEGEGEGDSRVCFRRRKRGRT